LSGACTIVMVPELVMPPPLKENWIALALLNGAMAQIIAIRHPRRKYRLVTRIPPQNLSDWSRTADWEGVYHKDTPQSPSRRCLAGLTKVGFASSAGGLLTRGLRMVQMSDAKTTAQRARRRLGCCHRRSCKTLSRRLRDPLGSCS